MAKIKYKHINFRKGSLALISVCNKILEDYEKQGFDLTLRQLYYQLVSQNIIPNQEKSYTNLGNLVADGRMAGLIDWNHIVDRVRNLRSLPNWDSPNDILETAASGFHMDWWSTQENRIEIWVEKEALLGVISKVGVKYDIPYYTTKGFNSQSEMWSASKRFIQHSKNHQEPIILYLGDHDPSGLDMSRDIQDRLWMFQCNVEIIRLALNIEQVEAMKLPENPAKRTDPRYKSYRQEFETESSWELDAISPSQIVDIISQQVESLIDFDEFELIQSKENNTKKLLGEISSRYDEVVSFLA